MQLRGTARLAMVVATLSVGATADCAAPAAAAALATCTADCDGDGRVTVADLVSGVRVLLLEAPLDACTRLDRNRSKAVEVDELIAAVSQLLDGCVPAPGAGASGAIVATVRALSVLSYNFLGVLAGTRERGADGRCPLAGTAGEPCDTVGLNVIRMGFAWDGCSYASPTGSLRLDGELLIQGVGFCPLPPFSDAVADFAFTATRVDEAGAVTEASTYDLVGRDFLLQIGAPPCTVRGWSAVYEGGIESQLPDGSRIRLDLDETHVTVRFDDPEGQCSLTLATLELDGPVRVIDESAPARVELDVALEGVQIVQRLGEELGGSVEVAGGLDFPCLDGFEITTVAPFRPALAERDPAAGSLLAETPAGRFALHVTAAGVEMDLDADGGIDDRFESYRGEAARACEM